MCELAYTNAKTEDSTPGWQAYQARLTKWTWACPEAWSARQAEATLQFSALAEAGDSAFAMLAKFPSEDEQEVRLACR